MNSHALYVLLAIFALTYLIAAVAVSWWRSPGDWIYHTITAPFVLVLGLFAVLAAGVPGLIAVAVMHVAVTFRLLASAETYAPAPDAHASDEPLFRIEERSRDDGPGRHRRS